MVEPVEQPQNRASVAEDHARWLEAMAEQYDKMVPVVSDSRRRRFRVRIAALRNRAQILRQRIPQPEAGSN